MDSAAESGMPQSAPRWRSSCRPAPVITILSSALALSACGKAPLVRPGNVAPHVRIMVPAPEDGSISYSSTLYWAGWDDDGAVDHYDYAIDIPDSIPLTEIDDPAGTSVAWQSTHATRGIFYFETPVPPDDDDGADLLVDVSASWVGSHCFYVRAVDNLGAVSPVEYRCFTATNLAPRTVVTVPCTGSSGIAVLSTRLRAQWSSTDPDNVDTRGLPDFYEWKLILIPSARGVHDAQSIVDARPEPWSRLGPERNDIELPLVTGQAYLFVVRGIDAGGVVEDRYLLGGNATLISSEALSPTLVIRDPWTETTRTFPANGPLASFDFPTGHCLRLDIKADASGYCESVASIGARLGTSGTFRWPCYTDNYGWGGSCSGLCYTVPKVDTLQVLAVDTLNDTTLATLVLRAH